ncbi:MAG: ROK family protein [Pyrinomonadaceae bacterium]
MGDRNSEYVLAADLGGTNMRIGIVDREGNILARERGETPSVGSPLDIADTIAALTKELLDSFEYSDSISMFGLAIPAVIDFSSGKISIAPNLPQLDRTDLSGEVESLTGLNVVLENDATAAAIGEHWLGAAKGTSNAICITLGTGVGGGLIINNKPFSGADGTAGEIGHICVEPEGPKCGCGSRGCIEQFASATAIVRIVKERMDAQTQKDFGEITAKHVHDAAVDGDAIALSVFETVGYYLGIAFADLVNVLNPEVIAVAGGAAASFDLFMPMANSEMRKRAFQQPAERVKIVRGLLGDDAGILGAAKKAFDQADKRSI